MHHQHWEYVLVFCCPSQDMLGRQVGRQVGSWRSNFVVLGRIMAIVGGRGYHGFKPPSPKFSSRYPHEHVRSCIRTSTSNSCNASSTPHSSPPVSCSQGRVTRELQSMNNKQLGLGYRTTNNGGKEISTSNDAGQNKCEKENTKSQGKVQCPERSVLISWHNYQSMPTWPSING